MKNQKLSTLLLFVACPFALLADSATDRKIEAAAKGSYNFQTVLDNKVSASAKDGVVTLNGIVADKDDRDLAADTVENLPGVTQVHNDLIVQPAFPAHSDGWMALKIRGLLLVKANVSATTTTVTVKESIVTLTGTVENLAQKELTEVYAREIDGVKLIKNDLVVKAAPASTATIGEKIDDASITTQVKFALLSHKSTSALKTKITTNDGVITISGDASSDAEKSLVTKLAQGIRGVKSIENSMVVKA